MTFSVATSWLLPMNDRLHVKTGLDLSGSEEEYQARMDGLGAYLGTLPEYSIVEVMLRYGPGLAMTRVVGAVVYGAEGGSLGSAALPVMNLFVLGVDYTSLVTEDAVGGVGYEITARDVPHAVVRVVPDMTETRTQDDLDRFNSEAQAIGPRMEETLEDLLETMPDGSLIDRIVPGGSPDPDSGALVDYRYRYIVYGGYPHQLPSEAEYVSPHLPEQDGGGGDDGGDDGGNNDPN